jgi:hypothetical protein
MFIPNTGSEFFPSRLKKKSKKGFTYIISLTNEGSGSEPLTTGSGYMRLKASGYGTTTQLKLMNVLGKRERRTLRSQQKKAHEPVTGENINFLDQFTDPDSDYVASKFCHLHSLENCKSTVIVNSIVEPEL